MSKDSTPKPRLMRNIVRAMLDDPLSTLPPFPVKFHTVAGGNRVRLYLREVEPSVLEYVHEVNVADVIMAWIMDEVIGCFSDYEMGPKDCLETARMFRGCSPQVEKIHNVLWQGEEGMTFRRLPWARASGPCPTFDDMGTRVSNWEALKCFIGSLLVDEADRQQYVWLHGQGQNGKGALSRFLHRVLGGVYTSQVPPANGDKFWTSNLLGKRLCVFPDCNNTSFVTSGLFKSLTGGDPVKVEQKNQHATTAILPVKYLFLSNERPSLSSEKADQRRIIYCEVTAFEGDPDPEYEERLWAEGGAFLSHCLELYQSRCPKHGQIPVDNSDMVLEDWVSTVEEEFETVFSENFELDKDSEYVLPAAFQKRLDDIWPRDRRSQREFRGWLERCHKIRKRTHHGLTGTPKVYRGLKIIYAGNVISTGELDQRDLQDGKRDGKGRKMGIVKPLNTKAGMDGTPN